VKAMRITALLRDLRGARRVVADALAALAARGHAVTLVVPSWAPADHLPGVARVAVAPVLGDGTTPRDAFGMIKDLDERFRAGRAAVPSCEGADALLLDADAGIAAVATHVAGPRKVALLLGAPEIEALGAEPNLHDDDRARILALRSIAAYTARRCALSLAFEERHARPTAGRAAARLLAPATDLALAQAAQHASDLMECGRPIVATLRPPTQGAGLDALLQAFREIRREASRATLVMAGVDPHFFPARRAYRDTALERFAHEHRDAVIFRPDDGPAGARALMASADIALAVGGGASGADVVPALSAGAPLVLGLEAGSDPRLRSWLAPSEAATLVPALDPAAIARAVLDLHGDRARALSQAARGRVVARERFGIERLVTDLEAALGGA